MAKTVCEPSSAFASPQSRPSPEGFRAGSRRARSRLLLAEEADPVVRVPSANVTSIDGSYPTTCAFVTIIPPVVRKPEARTSARFEPHDRLSRAINLLESTDSMYSHLVLILKENSNEVVLYPNPAGNSCTVYSAKNMELKLYLWMWLAKP